MAPVEVAAVILDAVAESNFLDHLQVVQRAFLKALGFEVFGLFGEELLLLFEVLLDFPHGLIGGGFAGDKQISWVNDDVVKPVQPRPRFRINGFQLLNLIAPKMYTQRVVGVGEENINGIALDPEGSAFELRTRAAVQPADQCVEEGVAAPFLSHLQWNHALVKLHRVADAVDAADGGDDDDVAPAAEQRRGGAQSELFDFLVDGEVFLDVGVGRGDVRLGLVIVVVADEVLHEVVGEEFLELAVELSGEGLVVAQNQGGPSGLCDDVGHREGLAGPRDAEEGLRLGSVVDPLYQIGDSLGLIAGRLIFTLEVELHLKQR